MRVLHPTNMPALYCVEFFNRVAGEVDLTVAYESCNDSWFEYESPLRHVAVLLEDEGGKSDLSRAWIAKLRDAVSLEAALGRAFEEWYDFNRRLRERAAGYTIETILEGRILAFFTVGMAHER